MPLFTRRGGIVPLPWNLSGMRYTGKKLDVGALGAVQNSRGAQYNDDGSRLLVAGASSGMHQYNLSRNWDILSASYIGRYDPLLSYDGTAWREDGSQFIVCDDSGVPVNWRNYDTSTDWTAAGMSPNGVSSDISSQTSTPFGIEMSADGTKLYVTDLLSDGVDQYGLSPAWDVASASYQKSSSLVAETIAPRGFLIRRDNGLQAWSWTAKEIFQYELGSAWDVGTVTYEETIDLSGVLTEFAQSIESVRFDVTGTRVLVTSRFPKEEVWDFTT